MKWHFGMRAGDLPLASFNPGSSVALLLELLPPLFLIFWFPILGLLRMFYRDIKEG